MGLFNAPFPRSDCPRAFLRTPPPAHDSRRGFREPSPRKTRVGAGSFLCAEACKVPGEVLLYFSSLPPNRRSSPGRALSPGIPGQPRPHRHARCPGGFSHRCGRRRHGNELIRGGSGSRPGLPRPRHGSAWPGPARCSSGLRESSFHVFFGGSSIQWTWLTLGTPRGCRCVCRPGEPWRPPAPSLLLETLFTPNPL